MHHDNILTRKIQGAVDSGRKALIPFVPAGFPSRERFWDVILELDDQGADVIEIGVPFSDPVADGPVVEKASIRCLEQGVNLDWIFEGLARHRKDIQAGLVFMGYFNPFLQYGVERLSGACKEAGVSGLIIPDLILEEAEPYKEVLEENNLAYIPLVGLNTSTERLQEYARLCPAFVYVVSVMGITGTKSGSMQVLGDKLRQVQDTFECPVALGFGISSKDQLESIEEHVDAVVFGSALIKHLDEGKSPREFMAGW